MFVVNARRCLCECPDGETPAQRMGLEEQECPPPEAVEGLPRPVVSAQRHPLQAQVPAREWGEGQVVGDEFTVLGHLGRGGMGTVYLVESRAGGHLYAVKRALAAGASDEALGRAFRRELQQWIGLPPHPHIAACRFVRTIDGQIAVFSEYVEGGSLADWIRQGRLASAAVVLDVAIQVAWGIDAAHCHGTVHQDVKPGNVLMTSDGIAKVTDFGLARARRPLEAPETGSDTFRLAVARSQPSEASSPFVSFAGYTPAYCSPEQYARRPVSAATDVWSWGVSVLEMVLGAVTWSLGPEAPMALERHLGALAIGGVAAGGRPDEARQGLRRVPDALVQVLGRCFRQDPAGRWSSLREAADALVAAYEVETGRRYPRTAPERAEPTRGDPSTDGVLDGALYWLWRARAAAGLVPTTPGARAPASPRSARARAVDELSRYEEAVALYQRVVDRGHTEFLDDLADACAAKAEAHQQLGDYEGALECYDMAARRLARHWRATREAAAALGLARCYQRKAGFLHQVGENRAVLPLCEQAITLSEQEYQTSGSSEAAAILSSSLECQANALGDLGAYDESLAAFDRALALLRRIHGEGDAGGFGALARVYGNKAITLRASGQLAAAVVCYDQAIGIRERLRDRGMLGAAAYDLAVNYMNKGAALGYSGDSVRAAECQGQAIEVLEELISTEGPERSGFALSLCYSNRGVELEQLGRYDEAMACYDRAVDMLRRLAHGESRQRVMGEFGRSLVHRAGLRLRRGQAEMARMDAREAESVLSAEAQRTGRPDMRESLEAARALL
ncbi:MAG TPA: serine/threonine-protein kinase, partial [Armatimonadota bacterium]|nr:serine/threonine-protein kinase [Armatimonadota bacterium]